MSEKTIKGMHKTDLIQLYEETILNINKINESLNQVRSVEDLYNNINDKKSKIDNLYSAIFDEGGQKFKIDDFLNLVEVNTHDLNSAMRAILDEHNGYLPNIKNTHKESLSSLKSMRQTSKKTTNIEEKLNKLADKFDSQDKEINTAYHNILNTTNKDGISGIFEKIQNAQQESEDKLTSIKNAYQQIFTDSEKEISIKNQLDNFVTEFQEHNKKFTEFSNNIFGYTETNKDGQKVKYIGKLKNTENIFDEYQEKHDKLFTQIEGLLSGATTTSLSKNFDDKVIEYTTERKKWENRIFSFLSGLAIVSIALATLIVLKDVEKNLIYTIGMPIYTFSIWLMIFMGNRRAESRKLEEAFKHKFVMAKSFVGYKKSIIEMDDYDKELMKTHMNNLLNAINKDSSKFFEIKGESHPFLDFFKRSKKIDKPS